MGPTCSCVHGSPPSSPLQDELRWVPKELAALTAIAAYHGASTALSAVVLRHPELDLIGLEDDLSVGKLYDDVLVVARRLEPIDDKVARGLTFAAVRNIQREERELDVTVGAPEPWRTRRRLVDLPLLRRVWIRHCKDKQICISFHFM